MAYEPTEIGEIPARVQEIESIGEAYHDFVGDRSNEAVRRAIQVYFQRTRGQSEQTTSLLIHQAFNGGDPVIKADLRLQLKTNTLHYEPADLGNALFFGQEDVRPLVFIINRARLEAGNYDVVLNELERRLLPKYRLRRRADGGVSRLCVTNDAYKRDDRMGTPFNTIEEMAGSTVFDPGNTGQADVTAAQNEGRFHLDADLVEGSSYWGQYRITTALERGRYSELNISLTLNGQRVQPARADLTFNISYPKAMLRGPSVEILAMIYKMVTEIPGILTDIQIRRIVGAVRIRNTQAGSFDEGFYRDIITHCGRLKRINPSFALIFIFFMKELGDMLQHKVGIKYKHLAIGTTDGLSSIAFLKRGGPISYTPKEDGLLFRVAGTLHKTDGMTADDIAAQRAQIQAEAAAREAAAVAAREAERQRGIEREARRLAQIEQTRLEALAVKDARRQLMADRRSRVAGKRGRNNNVPQPPTKRQRESKQVGGSKWGKTFKKQKGGSHDALFTQLINGLYLNLYYVINNPGADTSLFNALGEDNTILVNFDDGHSVFLNNKVLGLPLCSILYMLYDELYDVDFDTALELIIQFLQVFNFTDADIERIVAYINARPYEQDIAAMITQAQAQVQQAAAQGNPLARDIQGYDKDLLRKFVDKGYDIPGIIPYEYANRRINITPTSYELPVEGEEILRNDDSYNLAVDEEDRQGPAVPPIAETTVVHTNDRATGGTAIAERGAPVDVAGEPARLAGAFNTAAEEDTLMGIDGERATLSIGQYDLQGSQDTQPTSRADSPVAKVAPLDRSRLLSPKRPPNSRRGPPSPRKARKSKSKTYKNRK